MVYVTDPLYTLEVRAEQFDDPEVVSQMREATCARLSALAFELARSSRPAPRRSA